MPWIPFVKTGYLGTNAWVPLVNGNGLTAGGGEPVPEIKWVKVSGTSPLSLPDAIANSIKSMTQYGKCVQASTPAPSSPVDIKCNNGVLTMVDDELPSGYKRITGIKFDGDFWYNTNEPLTGEDDVTMTLANTATSGQNVFGSYNGTSDGAKNFSLYIYGGGSTGSSYFRYGEQLLRPKFGGNERTITFGKSGTSGFATDVAATPETFTTVATAYIGMLPNSSSPAYTGSIMGSILVGTRLKWIPCERESDGMIGYYEAVNGVFLEPVGTGTPVAGSYDTSHLNRLEVVGTPEVLTIGNQTAHVENLFEVTGTADEQDIISGLLTRRVGIMVLDGTEEIWGTASQTPDKVTVLTNCYTVAIPLGNAPIDKRRVYCTHLNSSDSLSAANERQGYALLGNGGAGTPEPLQNKYAVGLGLMTMFPTIAGLKQWLAEQYAAGTPVIIIYPLAEEITESVAAQHLKTAVGDNTVSVTSNVDPVQLSVEYADGYE